MVPDGKVGVYDGKGRLRGLVGPKATAATAARFHGQLGRKLGTKDGKPAWIAPTLGAVSAEGSATPGATRRHARRCFIARRDGNASQNGRQQWLRINHISHGLGPAHTGHAVPRQHRPRRRAETRARNQRALGHGHASKSGDALGGDHKSALDAVSGNVVVPGAVTTAPGYGNAGVQAGHPFAKPPAIKKSKARRAELWATVAHRSA